MRINLNINITMRCNTVCANCNRGIGVVDWSDVRDMTVDDAERIVEGVKRSGQVIRKVNITGGEPTVNKQLPKLVEIFLGITDWIWVATNGIVDRKHRPTLPRNAKYMVWHLNTKDHWPVFVSPSDVRLEDKVRLPIKNHCPVVKRKGPGVEPEGFTQCSLARTIVRALGRDESSLFFDEPVVHEPDYSICRHCPISLGTKANKALGLEVARGRYECPTESFVGLKKDVKTLWPADSHLQRLVAKGEGWIDESTGLFVDSKSDDPKLHQLTSMG